MNVRDARKISAEALEDLRRRVVAAVDSGATQVEVPRVFGVSRPTVNRWVRAYQDRGEESPDRGDVVVELGCTGC